MNQGLSPSSGHSEFLHSEDPLKLPREFFDAVRATSSHLQPHVLWINVQLQRMLHFSERGPLASTPDQPADREYRLVRAPYQISTSRYGIGQEEDSNKTPLGLHRIAEKIGGDAPPGTVFKGRRPVGFTWEGQPDARITDRILWLDGLEPGKNRGGNVDSYRRYIYIHGTGNESNLGKPDTCGCTHVAAKELIPLFDILPVDTLIWISAD